MIQKNTFKGNPLQLTWDRWSNTTVNSTWPDNYIAKGKQTSPGVKPPAYKADTSHPSSTAVKIKRTYNSTPTIHLLVCTINNFNCLLYREKCLVSCSSCFISELTPAGCSPESVSIWRRTDDPCTNQELSPNVPVTYPTAKSLYWLSYPAPN